jgi:hypothetical protein
MTDTATKTYHVAVIERALAYYEVEAESPRDAAENWSDGEFYDRDDEALETEGPASVRERQPDGTWRKVPRSEWEDEPPPAVAAAIPPDPSGPSLRAALTWLLDDIADSGEDRDPDTGVEYDSIAFARAALARSQDATMPAEPVAARLLAALKSALQFLEANDDGEEDVTSRIAAGRAAITEAEAAGLASPPPPASNPAKKPYSVLLLYPDHVNDDGTETYYDFVEATDPIAAVAEATRHALATNEWTEEDVDPDDFVPLLVTEGHHDGL